MAQTLSKSTLFLYFMLMFCWGTSWLRKKNHEHQLQMGLHELVVVFEWGLMKHYRHRGDHGGQWGWKMLPVSKTFCSTFWCLLCVKWLLIKFPRADRLKKEGDNSIITWRDYYRNLHRRHVLDSGKTNCIPPHWMVGGKELYRTGQDRWEHNLPR